ncbi:villin [Tribonema minus]|uniref:Villin n=1 Tax=Tribonema minus TaxID=303371 RepID=A0A835YKP2_9STRA|nr:villin [Tribonema minus]
MATFVGEEAFVGAGETPGLELWRVENKKMVKMPECNGKFYTGDSYILLATISTGRSTEWKIHFWLGAESSQDEMGIAAFKTCELDEMLGGSPVQYREVQGYESAQFLCYFKAGGIEYLMGGVASGFRKVERDAYRTRLLQVKGRRVARVIEVPLSGSSLNTGDVFILDAGLTLYLYNGAGASRAEKSKGVETITRIKDDERGGRAQVVFIHEDPTNAEFWDLLGGYVEVTAEGEPDAVAERIMADALQLHAITPEGTTELLTTGADGLKREMLATTGGYLLDTSHEIYLWIGHKADAFVKQAGMAAATQYLSANARPAFTPISRVAEGTETAAFKSFFLSWTSPALPGYLNRAVSKGVAMSPRSQTNARALSERAHASHASMTDVPVDDGSGDLTIWRIENFQRAEWPRERYGQFYGGDSYILLYSYDPPSGASRKKQHIIYFWQGRDSTADEIGTSALLAKELDDSMGGSPVQVRVTQGKEPKHFRMLFKGAMVVHAGGVASGFASASGRLDVSAAALEGAERDVACFHVKGSNALNTYGVQVPAKASSLNSGDCFLVITPTTVYMWIGTKCSSLEMETATKIGESLLTYKGASGRDFVAIQEGEETPEFWDALGGEGPYLEAAESEEVAQAPRMFQISNATGAMTVEEVPNFDQSDLCNDDVMLLDCLNEVYVWVGGGSNAQEQREAMDIAKAYIETATDGRSRDTPIVRVTAGSEPPMFTQHFRGWDADLMSKRNFVDPFEAKVEIVDGADNNNREASLSPEEFKMVFGMTHKEFLGQPKWKQVAAKKKAELF